MNALQRDLELKRLLMKVQARKGDLLAFTRFTMSDYEVNWHHELMCKYLTRFARGEIKRLMLFLPPRHGKSELTSRRLPAMLHGMYPNAEILAASYNAELASDMTVDVQRIMDRPEYKEIFPTVSITPEGSKGSYKRNRNEHEIIPYQDPKDRLWHWYEGSYKSAGLAGSFTGRGGNFVLIDDPIKNGDDADSPSFRESLHKFYISTISTRLEKDASILITHTRWHEDDLAGRLLRLAKQNPEAEQWVVLSLPAIKEIESDDPEDPRFPGELLWPSKYTMKQMMERKASGSRMWAALYQQNPIAEGGNIIKADHIKYYKVMPSKFDVMITSWDFAVKAKQTSDYAVGSVYGRIGADVYLVGQTRGRFEFPIACQKFLEQCKAYPKAHKKLVEGKAVGPAIIQTLRSKVTGIVEVEPSGDKVARLNAVAPMYESGNVWYPDPSIAPWINDHVHEMCAFPNGEHDDRVDAESQALNELRSTGPVFLPTSGHGSGTIF